MAEPTTSMFLWPDYLVFGLILALSTSIGVYHGIVGRKKQSIESYLMADRNMHPIPVAFSLFVSYMSAVSFLGDPVEVFSHGAVYVFIGVGYMMVMPLFAHVFAPFYQSLKITSAYEYLEMRYNKYVRLMGTMLNMSALIYSGIALYAPSLALSQVTDISLWTAIICTGLVCTIYTTLGGMKAVMWADSAQLSVMVIGMVILLVRGSMYLGGFSEVLAIAERGGRLNMWTFDPNIFRRSTFWTYTVGGFCRILVAFSSAQMFIQRVCTVSSKRKASVVSYMVMPLFGGIVVLFCMMGLVLYAYFHNCDPYLTGKISKRDQMLPLMMTEMLQFIPGLPGLFLGSIYCAALSTISSVQNSLATTFMTDILNPLVLRFRGKELADRPATNAAKLCCFIIGLVNIALSLVLSQLEGSVFKMGLTIDAMLTSPKAAVFILGVLAPIVDTTSALLGGCCALCFTLYLGLSTNINPPVSQALPSSIDGCLSNYSYLNGDSNETTFLYGGVNNVLLNGGFSGNNSSYTPAADLGIKYEMSASNLSPLLINAVGLIVTITTALCIAHIRACVKKYRGTDRINITDSKSSTTKAALLNDSSGKKKLPDATSNGEGKARLPSGDSNPETHALTQMNSSPLNV